MNTKLFLVLSLLGLSSASFASGISEFTIPFDNQVNAEGTVQVNMDTRTQSNINITKSFYGADTHGFSAMPEASLVTPLQLGLVKMGGSLHSVYNWQLDAYYDSGDHGVFYVYSPLERRIKLIQLGYKASPMFQINMLGWQPEKDANGKFSLQKTADAKHAGDAITFINGTKKLGLQHILMGNEPFESLEVHGKAIPSADEYIDSFIKYAVAVRSAQEKVSGNSNDIKLWGPEIATGWNGWQTTHPNDCITDYNLPEKMKCSYGEGRFTEFMPYFLYRIAQFEKDTVNNPKKYKMLDVITLHYYPLFRKDFKDPGSIILNNDGTQNVAGMLESVNLWNSDSYINKFDSASPKGVAPKIVKKFQDWRSKYYPNSKLALTEFAVDSMANIAYHPIVRPLYLADLIARLGSAGVDTFVNSFLQGGDSSELWSMINGNEKSKLFNIYALYSNYFVGKVLTSDDSFGDKVNVYSVKGTNGTNVFLVNKDTKVHSTDLNFKKGGDVESVTQVSLPAWSVTVLSVPDNHDQLIKVHQYGAKEMGIEVDDN
jgi:hypothetical protein